MIGLEVDEAIQGVVARLSQKGVPIKGSVVRDENGSFVHLEDPDGNEIYLWEVDHRNVPQTEFAHAGSVQYEFRR